jgi:hypothetical protein
MIPFLSFLVFNKVGRYVLLAAILAALVGVIFLRVYNAGKHAEQAKAAQRQLERLRNAIDAADEVRGMSRADRDEYVAGWLRDSE